MSGEADLARLLASLDPELDGARWRFVTGEVAPAEALMTFVESEGVTAIIPATADDPDAFARLTLRVHSSLDAVGLTAAVSRCLADAGIPANVVAAFHHDHVFVPWSLAEQALAALRSLQSGPR